MASLSKGAKALQQANKATEALRASTADISRATKTPQQVIHQQAADDIKHAASHPENDKAFQDGQTRLEASQDEAQERYAAIDTYATECGERLSKDTEFVRFESDVAEWKRNLDYKPVYCMKFLQKNLTKDQLARLPWPKTTEKEVTGNEVFDIIKVYEEQPTGESKLVATSFYKQMARATPEGKRAANEVKSLKNATGTDGKAIRKASESGERTNFNTIVSAMETAGKLLIQAYRLSLVEDVAWEWIKDEDGEIIKTPKCIMAWSPSNMQTMDYHSISQFVSWKVPKVLAAKKKGIIAVRASVAKAAPKITATPKGKAKWEQKSLRELLDAMSESLSYYNKGSVMDITKRHQELVEMLGRSAEDRMTCVHVYRMLKPLCEANNGEMQRLADQDEARIQDAMKEKKVA